MNTKNVHMKMLLLIFSLVFLINSSYCQLKQISVSKITYQQEKNLRCIDSTDTISKFCSVDLDGFRVRFYAAYLDKSKGELQLIGRVCVSDKMNSSGISDIEIFKGRKIENKLIGRSSVGETTDGKSFINNDGFFDIKLKIEKNESLFFHSQRYFLKEFAISKLLQ